MISHGSYCLLFQDGVLFLKASGSWNEQTHDDLHIDVLKTFSKLDDGAPFLQITDVSDWDGTTFDGYEKNLKHIQNEPKPTAKIVITGPSLIKEKFIRKFAWDNDHIVGSFENVFVEHLEGALQYLAQHHNFDQGRLLKLEAAVAAAFKTQS